MQRIVPPGLVRQRAGNRIKKGKSRKTQLLPFLPVK